MYYPTVTSLIPFANYLSPLPILSLFTQSLSLPVVYLVEAKLGYKCAIPSKKWDIKKPKSKGPSVDGEDENSEKDGFLVDDYCEYLLVK